VVAVKLGKDDMEPGLAQGTYAFSVQLWSIQGLQDVERLHYAAVRFNEPGVRLSDEEAERLIVTASQSGEGWLEARREIDPTQAAKIVDQECLGQAEKAFAEYLAEIRFQNEDRADVQERTLEKHLFNQKDKLIEVRNKHREKGRDSLVRATDGRIQALEGRVEQRRHEIASRREVRASTQDVCIGVIDVS
jgi:hypothetical protein